MTELVKGNFTNLYKFFIDQDTDCLLIVVDGQVWQHYKKDLRLNEVEKYKRVIVWKTPDGEGTKNFSEYQSCLEFFIEKNVHRNAHLIAIGGGATSDFAGFVASSLLRGIKWSVVPTTLLSMVDASIGGKVAINSKSGKNLIGSFHLPKRVFFNFDFLNSLAEEEIKSGKGEIFKYTFLDNSIHDLVMKKASLEDLIMASANYKIQITDEDFKESSKRKILNFGHTFGHSIELIYRLPHGEAVVWGAILIDKIFQEAKNIGKMKEVLYNLNWIPEKSPWLNKTFPASSIMEYLKKDKKLISNGEIDIILCHEVGRPEIKSMQIDTIEQKLNEISDELKQFTL